MKSTKLALVEQTSSFLIELQLSNPQIESLEWYLVNNLKKFLESVKAANNASEIKIATKILSRFCTESMNWDTELYKKCTDITKIGFKLGKED